MNFHFFVYTAADGERGRGRRVSDKKKNSEGDLFSDHVIWINDDGDAHKSHVMF
jgi:hypothetical protein